MRPQPPATVISFYVLRREPLTGPWQTWCGSLNNRAHTGVAALGHGIETLAGADCRSSMSSSIAAMLAFR